METVTPMLQQYHAIKARHPDCILFFRLGDFYEMFYDDAIKASALLDLVLTSRQGGKSGAKVPMCGIPYHAADNYIARLIKSGAKVAICEQTEDPAKAQGLVKRDVVRVITAGTYIDTAGLETRALAALCFSDSGIGLAFNEANEGVIAIAQFPDPAAAAVALAKINPVECLFAENQQSAILAALPLKTSLKTMTLSPIQDWMFNPDIARKSLCEHLKVQSLCGFGVNDSGVGVSAAGSLLEYLRQMNKQPILHINRLAVYSDSDNVFIPPQAVIGLQLEELFRNLDETLTAMGRRTLKKWIYAPLKDVNAINTRQAAVSMLAESRVLRERLRTILKNTPDSEKSLARLSCGWPPLKDLLNIAGTLARLPELDQALAAGAANNRLLAIADIPELRALLASALDTDVKNTSSVKDGFSKELDELKGLRDNGRRWLKEYQAGQIQRTGISSLKIGYTGVFGYYIEVTRPNLHLAPPDYLRKQTLVNAERFTTAELAQFETKMLTAEEKVRELETRILEDLRKSVLEAGRSLQQTASDIGRLDAILSLSAIAGRAGYTAPTITDQDTIEIIQGRHPVVEAGLNNAFCPNDTLLDRQNDHLLIITGPNMAGKSTYIRQTATLVIMAQAGSFIPAKRAVIGVADKIFTRIGAHDDIAKGQSTFMVEMSETAAILNNLTPKSLVVLDEIGRGTSTYDGLSLAWAIAEDLAAKKTRTLFATHFHELTALGQIIPGIKNYNVAVKETPDEIIFLHKIIPGGCDDSFGIYVAKLAGIPADTLARAGQILARLENGEHLKDKIWEKSTYSPPR